jgi:hypothetical protein
MLPDGLRPEVRAALFGLWQQCLVIVEVSFHFLRYGNARKRRIISFVMLSARMCASCLLTGSREL